MTPNITDYTLFLRNVAGINTTVLPDNSAVIEWSFNYAMNVVSDFFAVIPQTPDQFLYGVAVYNLATDTLLNYAQDQPGQTFFAQVRQKYQLNVLIPGVVTEARDEDTSTGIINPKFMQGLTMGNLQNLKTPFGRQYLALAQDLGSLSLMGIA